MFSLSLQMKQAVVGLVHFTFLLSTYLTGDDASETGRHSLSSTSHSAAGGGIPGFVGGGVSWLVRKVSAVGWRVQWLAAAVSCSEKPAFDFMLSLSGIPPPLPRRLLSCGLSLRVGSLWYILFQFPVLPSS